MNRRKYLVALGGAGATTAIGGLFLSLPQPKHQDTLIRDHPLAIPRFQRKAWDPGLDRMDLISRRLNYREDMSFPDILHWLRVFGSDMRARTADPRAASLLCDLTDSRKLERRYRAASGLVATAFGAQYLVTRPGMGQSHLELGTHAYQAISVYGEIGVPADTAIITKTGQLSVRDLVIDCMMNYQLRSVTSKEAEWGAIALIEYLPPTRSWQNRFREEVTFDALADYLLGRLKASGACGNTHLLFAIALLGRAHEQYQILNRKSSTLVTQACDVMTRAMLSSQNRDGSWSPGWDLSTQMEPEEPGDRVHMTGHLLEIQSILPVSTQASTDMLGRALAFLESAIRSASDEEIANLYCPYSHAGRVLLGYA